MHVCACVLNQYVCVKHFYWSYQLPTHAKKRKKKQKYEKDAELLTVL